MAVYHLKLHSETLKLNKGLVINYGEGGPSKWEN